MRREQVVQVMGFGSFSPVHCSCGGYIVDLVCDTCFESQEYSSRNLSKEVKVYDVCSDYTLDLRDSNEIPHDAKVWYRQAFVTNLPKAGGPVGVTCYVGYHDPDGFEALYLVYDGPHDLQGIELEGVGHD